MKIRQFCIDKKTIIGMCIFVLTFSSIIANRSSIIFINGEEAIYTHHTQLFHYNLTSHKSTLIKVPQNKTSHLVRHLAEIAISAEDGYYYASNPDHNGALKFKLCCESENEYFIKDDYCEAVVPALNNGYINTFFLSDNANAIILLYHIGQYQSFKCCNLKTDKNYELDEVQTSKILSQQLRATDITNDGNVVVFNVYTGGGLYIWKPVENSVFSVDAGLEGSYFNDFALAPDGSRLLSISGNGAELWNINDRRFEYLFRWSNGIKDLETYSCPPKIDGWAIDRKIYYKERPNFFFNPEAQFKYKDKTKVVFMWGDVKKALFSPNSRFVFMLTELCGYFTGFARWRLNIFDIQAKRIVRTIPISKLTNFPDFMALSPDASQLLIMCGNDEMVHVPLN